MGTHTLQLAGHMELQRSIRPSALAYLAIHHAEADTTLGDVRHIRNSAGVLVWKVDFSKRSQTMSTDKIDPNKNPTEVPPKDVKTELTEEELKKVSGGTFKAFGDIKGETTDKDHKDWVMI